MSSNVEQRLSQEASGREWKTNRTSLRALDVLTSDVPHLLIRTPPSSAIFGRHVPRQDIAKSVNGYDDGVGTNAADLASQVCLFSFQQSRDEQTIILPCQHEGGYDRLKQEIEALIADEQQCMSSSVPPDRWQLSGPWRVMRLRGPLEHHFIGIMQSLTTSFVQSGCSILALSTWDTDYLLLQEGQYERAVEGLKRDGWVVAS
ncbi:hypothetical protein BCV69DRAFT_298860 [Microstroma glucosiphilum]|uniref:CASTOR ACT domain-containing protein n=1 Tax=Pseudomicrostroma glucosiphilum TaxID=1684307 RepID=A0A316U8A0_9BASI|nr:hypothetical protein BCV69DRAFT_298860 [Pseudomicrostroma glucosiphilum]PWN21074.1 hypothetical protein BCV69DRAFT_298860 [Pseudomicrostroma glucosiphilum]